MQQINNILMENQSMFIVTKTSFGPSTPPTIPVSGFMGIDTNCIIEMTNDNI